MMLDAARVVLVYVLAADGAGVGGLDLGGMVGTVPELSVMNQGGVFVPTSLLSR